jgi:hypothetical protein
MTPIKLDGPAGPRLTAVNCLHHRHRRRGLSLWLVVALLFMQIATSAYACPGELFLMADVKQDGAAASSTGGKPAPETTLAAGHSHHPHEADPTAPDGAHHQADHVNHVADHSAAAALSPDMTDCDMAMGLDAHSPNLCKLHCEPGNQTPLHASASTDAPAAAALLCWAVLDWSSTALLPQQPGLTPRLGVASGAPPPGAPPLYLSLLVLRN